MRGWPKAARARAPASSRTAPPGRRAPGERLLRRPARRGRGRSGSQPGRGGLRAAGSGGADRPGFPPGPGRTPRRVAVQAVLGRPAHRLDRGQQGPDRPAGRGQGRRRPGQYRLPAGDRGGAAARAARRHRQVARRVAARPVRRAGRGAPGQPARLDLAQPDGGLCLWGRLPGRADSSAFAQAALRQGVAVVPGRLLSASNTGADSVRLAFTQPPDVLRAAVRKLSAIPGPSR